MDVHWTLGDISWDVFDPQRTTPDHIKIAKAASLVEYNAEDYGRYLENVFKGDSLFLSEMRQWVTEEIQHGEALGKWAKMADPAFDFQKAMQKFRKGFPIKINAKASIRGSRTGELLARCMVEVGTSSFYTTLKEATEEPVLKEICTKIAADELRHYKLFYTHMQRYLEHQPLRLRERLRIGMGRMWESEDDELAYAYYAANEKEGVPYRHAVHSKECLTRAYRNYQKHHLDRMIAMALKAMGLKPYHWVHKVALWVMWPVVSRRFK